MGQVVTSGYCNCRICCGVWSGGPTASGAYPTANHTIAVDASNPFVPIGTKVVMNGVEYTVERIPEPLHDMVSSLTFTMITMLPLLLMDIRPGKPISQMTMAVRK